MRIKLFLISSIFIFAGTSLYSNDVAPERMAGPAEWIGKGLGRVVDATVYQAWNWATDVRYDGLTKLRRFGALGCFLCAAGCLGSDAWKRWNNKRRDPKVLWKSAGFAVVGFLLTLRPEPVYVYYE